MVHGSVRDDAIAAARHRSFIGSHLFGGLLAAATFAVYLATSGSLTAITACAFFWLLSPAAIAVFLSRTGRFGVAHLVSAANLAGLVSVAAYLTGGIASFVIPWMLIVPLEAALSADRRVVFAATAIAGASLIAIAAVGQWALLPEPQALAYDAQGLALVTTAAALLYAGGLAFSIQAVHKQSEETVRQGEQRYRLLAENATDMISRHTAKGDVVFASLAAEHVIGEAAQELLGEGLLGRVHVADRPAYLTAFSQCAASHGLVSVQFRVRRGGQEPTSASEYIWLEMRCRPVTYGDDGGDGARPGEIVAVSRDISESKVQESVLLKARDTAEEANRAKTQFLANMSHELRTPLNAIIGFSEILARELFGRLGEDRYREYARLIHESGEHLLSVVNGILDMSKIEAGKFCVVPEPFEIVALVSSCSEIMRHAAETKSIALHVDAMQGLPELVADKKACKQMLLNLLSNAIKFTPEGGEVRVGVTCADGLAKLSVTDTGIGIAADDLPKLGNPFVQADTSYNRNFEGTGLGLSVVKGLARLHGGSVEIDSVLGAGTCVSVLLPLEGADGAAQEACAESEDYATKAAIGA